MFNKTFKVLAHTANIAAAVGLIAFGTYTISDAQAQEAQIIVSAEQEHCLQQNIFFEARNQSRIGQVSVAWVTLNRVDSTAYPDSICEAVWQNKQFSWTHDGKSDTPNDNVLEQRAWYTAGIIAEVVLIDWAREDYLRSPIEDAVMYHANYVNPYWASSYTQVATVDDHIFYN
jgi:N-acetylmuramoyl-L-alanine amidase